MPKILSFLVAASLCLAGLACKSDPTGPGAQLTLDHRLLCSPAEHTFTIAVANGWFPLTVGARWELEGIEEDDGEEILVHLIITILDETEVVGGVTTRVVEERESQNGELAEVSRNFFAVSDDGTVCYFGEDVDIYEDGAVVSHEGAWRADVAGNFAGIFIPANPAPGMVFQQEEAPGALDIAGILELGMSVSTPFATYTNTLLLRDCNPVEDPGCDPLEDGDLKAFVAGVGLVVDGPVELVDYEPGG